MTETSQVSSRSAPPPTPEKPPPRAVSLRTESHEDLRSRPPRSRGRTFISDDVVSIIARRAAEQTPGIYQIGESNLRSVFSRFGRHHGVEAEVGLKEAAVDIEVVVEFGHPIREVAQTLRETVIDAVESMTGRSVLECDIHVVDIHAPDRKVGARRQLE